MGVFLVVDMSLTSCIDTLPEPLHSTFSLQEKLGSGAYALVYRAQHRVSKESFALKVVQKDELEARQMIPQLRREIEFLTVLSGAPHIVQLHEVVDTRQHLFLRFELCGVNLEDVVTAQGAISTEDALRWTREVSEGLCVMHRLGQVHRDIKPSNMLLDAEGSVKICDFGWACLESDRKTGACGSEAYAPPEQLTSVGSCHTTRGDIYSLGASLQHLLLGRIPMNAHDVPRGRSEEVLGMMLLMMQPIPMCRPSAEELLLRPELASNILEKLWRRGSALLATLSEATPSEASTRAPSFSDEKVRHATAIVQNQRLVEKPLDAAPANVGLHSNLTVQPAILETVYTHRRVRSAPVGW